MIKFLVNLFRKKKHENKKVYYSSNIVEGTVYRGKNDFQIIGNKIIVDSNSDVCITNTNGIIKINGKILTAEEIGNFKEINVIVEGQCNGNIDTIGSVTINGNVYGDVSAEGDITCNNIEGDVDILGDATITNKIIGNIECSGDISCNNVNGNLGSMGDITINGSHTGNIQCMGNIYTK